MISVSTELRRLWDIRKKLFHRHRYDIQGAEKINAGLTGGRHTSFMLFKCKCREKLAFPEGNIRIALHEGTDETKELLKNLGLGGMN